MRSLHKWSGLLTLSILAVLLAGCSSDTSRAGKLRVVATFSILGDLVQNVAGDHAEVTTLVGPDGETIYEAMRSLRDRGKTLVVATHDLSRLDSEVEPQLTAELW
jgi:hypothetical protein